MDLENLSEQSSGQIFETLLAVMAQLRGPQGCPWDKKQDHHSLKSCLLEEAYEVLAAIDTRDATYLKEELGDLLLQVIFHAQIATEHQSFETRDIIQGLVEKLVRRHPHVFGDEKVSEAEEATTRWEKIKAQERSRDQSALSGVPKELPALLRAYRLGSKAARVGFDWKDVQGVLAKVAEEVKELHEEIKDKNQAKIEEEFGDLLFSLAQLARFLKLNPEEALRQSAGKFQNRFEALETLLREQKKKFEDCSLKELDEYWEQVKKFSFTKSV